MTDPDGLGKYYESMNQPGQQDASALGKPKVDWSKYEGIATGSGHPRNLFAYATLAVVAIYLVFAWLTGIALLGIAPLLLAFRSYQKGESLAIVAVPAAVGGVILGFILWPIF